METEPLQSTFTEMNRELASLDAEIQGLWRRRAALSWEASAIRSKNGLPQLELSHENQTVRTYRQTLGELGSELADLIIRAGRPPRPPHGNRSALPATRLVKNIDTGTDTKDDLDGSGRRRP